MLRAAGLLVAVLAIAAICDSAQAQCDAYGCEASHWDKFKQQTMRNKHWPYPFVEAERIAVDAPFQLMVANGWRRQNLMGEHHFDEHTELTPQGRLKIMWILTQAPASHRSVFVERSLNPEITRRRIDSIQRTIAELNVDAGMPDVQETHIQVEGRPAGQIDHVFQQFQETAPAPQLKAAVSEGFGS